MFVNKAIIYGNITKDPEVKAMPSGSSVCNFSVATNRVWYDQNKKKNEEVEFHNIVCFGKTAENVAHYMKKGNGIYIEGRIKTRSWKTQSGETKYKVEIIAENVQFGPTRLPQGDPEKQESTDTSTIGDDVGEEINPEDLPF